MARGLAVNLLKINNLQFPKLFALLVDSKHTICYTKRVADNTNNMKNTNTSFATVIRTSLPAGIWVLGSVSLLMDISSEMIHSLLPVFMVG